MKFIKKLIANVTIKNKSEREKKIATIKEEPWVKVIDISFNDSTRPGVGAFELDWNEQFIKMLTSAGYSGKDENEIVNTWFNDVCRGVLDDEDLPQSENS